MLLIVVIARSCCCRLRFATRRMMLLLLLLLLLLLVLFRFSLQLLEDAGGNESRLSEAEKLLQDERLFVNAAETPRLDRSALHVLSN